MHVFLAILIANVMGQRLPPEWAEINLGQINLTTSTDNQNATDWFEYGLLHLMSFGYDYATPAFATSRANDPSFALAYAFEALCHFWPLWGYDDVVGANEVLDWMIGNDTDASDQEQYYITAIQARFALNTGVEERTSNAISVFDDLISAYPSDATALAFRALWKLELSTHQDEPDSSSTVASAGQDLDAALYLEPTHPAAVHYILHFYDSSNLTFAAGGMPYAELYPQIVSGASHGLHMPVHIFLRFGLFEEAFDADTMALEAADVFCQLYGWGGDPGCDLWNLYHSLEYIQYTGFQIGEWVAASQSYERMVQAYNTSLSQDHVYKDYISRWYWRMDAREVLERLMVKTSLEDVEGIPDCESPDQLEPGFWTSHTEGGALLSNALCVIFKFHHEIYSDMDSSSRSFLEGLKTRLGEVATAFGVDSDVAKDYFIGQVNAAHVLMVVGAELFVQVLAGHGNDDTRSDAVTLLEQAMAIERSLSATADSPSIQFLSAHELFGHLMFLEGNSAEGEPSLAAYDQAESMRGDRLNILLGQARASLQAGCPLLASAYYIALEDQLTETAGTSQLPDALATEVSEGVASASSLTQEAASCSLDDDDDDDTPSSGSRPGSSLWIAWLPLGLVCATGCSMDYNRVDEEWDDGDYMYSGEY